MLDDDAYCVDVLLQMSAIRGALGKVGDIILDTHVRTCVAEAMESGSAAQRRKAVDDLMQVFERYGKGMTTNEIALQLHLSTKTIDTHRQKIKHKLDLRNTNEIVRTAAQFLWQTR